MTEEQKTAAQVDELLAQARWDDVVSLLAERPEQVARSQQLSRNLGWALLKLGRPEDAIDHFRRAVSIEPDKALNHWALGLCLREAGQIEAAAAALRRSLSLSDSSVARESLALMYMDLRRWQDAEDVLREGVQARPHSKERVSALARYLANVGRAEEARAWYDKADVLAPETVRDGPRRW